MKKPTDTMKDVIKILKESYPFPVRTKDVIKRTGHASSNVNFALKRLVKQGKVKNERPNYKVSLWLLKE